MRRFILAIMLAVIATASQANEAPALKKVKAEYVCMANDMAYDKQQVKTVVDGKSYYGCCPMCAEKFEKDAAIRKAIDPVSGKEVDKATAVIGAMSDGMVHYFENDANLQRYSGEMKHEGMGAAHSGHGM